MLVNTWLFLKFDIQVMSFTTDHTESFFNNLSTSFFNNTADLNLINYYYQPIKISEAVESVSDRSINLLSITNEKKYNKIYISSHNNIYDFTVADNIQHTYIIQIKKFDDVNYIVPLCLSASKEYTDLNDKRLDIRYLIQELDNIEAIKNKLVTFKKIVLI